MDDLVMATALEWWRCSGPRTRERLNNLVDHYADTYAIPAERRAELKTRAWERVPSWQRVEV